MIAITQMLTQLTLSRTPTPKK